MTEVGDVLKATRVPDTKLFFLGCFDSRVTVLSQQRRALNLVDAILSAGDLVRPNGRVAIVGGGVAGVTAAAALAIAAPNLKRIDLFERETELLHLQLHSDRDLHPFIYDWPSAGAADKDAGLPILNWRAGTAENVAAQILASFEIIRSQSRNLSVHCSAQAVDVKANEFGCRLSVSGRTADGGAYDVVILSIGYGFEMKNRAGSFNSYWSPSQLLGPAGEKPVIFVSGNGDGGLVDFTMATFDRMTHKEIIDLVVQNEELESVKDKLIEIERAAWAAPEGTFNILDQYRQLKIPSSLAMSVYDNLRDAKVWLHTREPHIFRKKSAILNRFTAFLAILADEKFERDRIRFVQNVQQEELAHGEILLGDTSIHPSIPIFRFGPAREVNIQPFMTWRDKFLAANPEQPSDYHPALPPLNASARARFSRLLVREEPLDGVPPAASPKEAARQWLGDRAIEVKAESLALYIRSGLPEAVRSLLEAGILPDTLLDGVHPIELALRQIESSNHNADASQLAPDPARVAILAALLAAGAKGAATAAHDALESSNAPRLVALLRAGLPLDAKDKVGQTLAVRAMRQDDGARGIPGHVTELLVTEGPVAPRTLGTWMLLWAAWTGRARLVERLLDTGIPVDAQLYPGLPTEPIEESEQAFWWPGGTALHRLLANSERPYAAFYEESRIYSWEVFLILIGRGASGGSGDALGRTPLHFAARGGLEKAAAALLEAPGLDLAHEDNEGETALLEAVNWRRSRRVALSLIPKWLPAEQTERARLLYRAAENRDEEILRALLDAGCDPNARAPGLRSTLVALAQDATGPGDQATAIPCLELLLERGADPAQKDESGVTTLHEFANGLELEVVDRLLAAGAEVEAVDANGRTPLMFSRTPAIAQRLLAAGAQPLRRDRYGYDALDHAVVFGRDAVATLLEQPNRTPRPEARLIGAVVQRDAAAVRACLSDGVPAATVGPDGTPALITAATKQAVDIMHALLDHGAAADTRDVDGSTALDACLWSMNTTPDTNAASISLLLARGARLKENRDARNGDAEAAVFKGYFWWRLDPIADQVLAANKGARSRKSATSLMFAAMRGTARQVEGLVREGVDVKLADQDGLTALHYVADGPSYEDEGEYPKKADILIAAGAEIDVVDRVGETPLFKAVRSGHVQTIEFLLHRGADPARRNSKDETMATVALQSRRIAVFNEMRSLVTKSSRLTPRASLRNPQMQT
ncbi:ankyrin repeat domain-containing protein [Bradyrhizobium sp. CIAT3101]|uniref:ankyrin repeat domain-containing protein n=1 Tax=Bradyrhizobium sp. CIAT3101 TaxID=439387 RepID=UPI0024B20AF6|nr:ankyrin repeat domain-containing protein [Bradyrhizobium sp. CIAT3101]WFU80754.1 ankyrin repeat domain-containing protein [Bradyrhizobium sp. CIAT3101]